MFRFFGKPPDPKPEQGGFERDTDRDWERIGVTEPFHGVRVDPKYLRANIDDAAKVEFFATGAADIAHHLAVLRERFGPFDPKSALDFGCGVGRLTRALARTTGDAFGADISEGMLREARAARHSGLQFGKELPERPFDWVVSLIVFQHIPPSRGYRLIRDLARRIAPGGCATLQFAIYRDARHADVAGGRITVADEITPVSGEAALRSLPEGEMIMFDYDLSIIVALLFNAGLEQLYLRHTNHGGFHGAILYGRRTA